VGTTSFVLPQQPAGRAPDPAPRPRPPAGGRRGACPSPAPAAASLASAGASRRPKAATVGPAPFGPGDHFHLRLTRPGQPVSAAASSAARRTTAGACRPSRVNGSCPPADSGRRGGRRRGWPTASGPCSPGIGLGAHRPSIPSGRRPPPGGLRSRHHPSPQAGKRVGHGRSRTQRLLYRDRRVGSRDEPAEALAFLRPGSAQLPVTRLPLRISDIGYLRRRPSPYRAGSSPWAYSLRTALSLSSPPWDFLAAAVVTRCLSRRSEEDSLIALPAAMQVRSTRIRGTRRSRRRCSAAPGTGLYRSCASSRRPQVLAAR